MLRCVAPAKRRARHGGAEVVLELRVRELVRLPVAELLEAGEVLRQRPPLDAPRVQVADHADELGELDGPGRVDVHALKETGDVGGRQVLAEQGRSLAN